MQLSSWYLAGYVVVSLVFVGFGIWGLLVEIPPKPGQEEGTAGHRVRVLFARTTGGVFFFLGGFYFATLAPSIWRTLAGG